VIALYAITDEPGPALPDVASIRLVAHRGLAAVCGPAADGEVTANVLWEHEQVVEALMESRDVLPVRYGTRLSDDAAALDALDANHDRLAQSLEFVRGAVEVSVRALTATGAPASPSAHAQGATSGTEYLRARAREAAVEEEAARAVHEPLAAVARAHLIRQNTLPGEVLRAAYLLNQGETAAFSRLVQKIQEESPSLVLTCTGPWPPYSFAER
jgi:gas vesicle protein GvpL/GvpF